MAILVLVKRSLWIYWKHLMLKCKLTRMMFMRVEKYSKINEICWDDFVGKAKNGHFLFICQTD